MRVFLDANILFSAALPQSRMNRFLALLFEHAEGSTNAYAAEEARRNLELKAPSAVRLLDSLPKNCELIPGLVPDFGVGLESQDMPILAEAIGNHATHLLTGDERHFGALFGKTVQGVKVVSPQMLADELVQVGLL